jgi:hypothetical protein
MADLSGLGGEFPKMAGKTLAYDLLLKTTTRNLKGNTMSKESPTTPDEMRQRVADLLEELDDPTLQWLHYEVFHSDKESGIETDEEAEAKGAESPPLDRRGVIAA